VSEPRSGAGRAAAKVLIAVVIVLAAGAGGFFYYVKNVGQMGLSPTAPDVPMAQSPSGTVAANPDVKTKVIPDTLPEITLANLQDQPTALASFAGRPLMVNFWATWCAPCRREIPLLNRLRAERQAQNAEIVGIAVDFKEDVLQFIQKVPVNYPLLVGEEDGLAAAEAFGMGMAFPFSIFVDSQNHILTIKVGELHEDEANFAFDRLRDIDAGVMTRQAAQAAVAEAFKQMAATRAQKEAQASESTPQAGE
jgi:thiol-disulfide isomerase/thioredoxin